MRRGSLLFLTVWLGAACADNGPRGVEPQEVTANGGGELQVWGPSVVVQGSTVLVGASRHAASGDTVAVPATWLSRDPSVAAVSGRGDAYADVSGIALGRTWIVAAAGGLTDSLEVSVVLSEGGGTDTTTAGSGPVASVELAPGAQTVGVGDSAGVFATLLDASGRPLAERPVTWTVSDQAVAGIEFQQGQSLILRARREGAVTVTATSEGKSGTAAVTVRQ